MSHTRVSEPTPLKKAAFKDTALPSTYGNKAIRVLFSRLFPLLVKPWFLRSPVIPLEASSNPDNFFFSTDYNYTIALVSYFLQQLKDIRSAELFQQRIRPKEVQTVAGTWGCHGQRGTDKFAMDKSITVEWQHCLGNALVALLEDRRSPTRFLSVCFLALDSNLIPGVAWLEFLSVSSF